jgi:hypothetical protein
LPTWLRLPLQESLEALHLRTFAAAEATASVVSNRAKKPWSIVAATGLPTAAPGHAQVAQAFAPGTDAEQGSRVTSGRFAGYSTWKLRAAIVLLPLSSPPAPRA